MRLFVLFYIIFYVFIVWWNCTFSVIIQCSGLKLRGKLRKRSFCAAARINERTSRRPIDCANSISPAWSRLFPHDACVLSYCESHISVWNIRAGELLVISRVGIRWGDHQWNRSCGQLKISIRCLSRCNQSMYLDQSTVALRYTSFREKFFIIAKKFRSILICCQQQREFCTLHK